MVKDWTADVVGRMHTAGITGQVLAKECGYCETYLSLILHSKRQSTKAKEQILKSLATLEQRLSDTTKQL